MANCETCSLKLCLNDGSKETKVKKFEIYLPAISNISDLRARVLTYFPELIGKMFLIKWKDDENDEITISSNNELSCAINEMEKHASVKFFIELENSVKHQEGSSSDVLHSMVYCDGCESRIESFRYKCLGCRDYDLCSSCEQKSLHSEHPMLRIPHPQMFDRNALHKLLRYLVSFVSHNAKEVKHHSHHRRRHSHDNTNPDFYKKKRKCDKYESGPETDAEDFFEGKLPTHKWKKMNRCLYKQLINDFFSHWDPTQFQTEANIAEEREKKSDENGDEPSHVKYLKTIGKTISSLLDPLGIDVDVEVRSKDDDKTKKEEFHDAEPQNKGSPSSSENSTPPQEKEVRFTTPEVSKEVMKQKIEEITEILANQKVNESPEKDDWVLFEELKRDMNESKTSKSTEAVPKGTQASVTTPSCPVQTEAEPKASYSQSSAQNENLYPNLNSSRVPRDPIVRQSLEKMLSMGFTNEGGWLTDLLEAKRGDIHQVLEVLTSYKKS